LCLVRAFETFVETVRVAIDGLVIVNRRPIAGRSTPSIVSENFAGSLHEAVEVLRRPPRAASSGTTPAWPEQGVAEPVWPLHTAI
jgi:hypothetical protein